MLCCAVLCCAVLCYAVLCCVVSCCAVLCCAALFCVVLCWCCAVLWFAVVCCSVVWCGVVCSAVLCCVVLCCVEGAVTRRQWPGCLPTGTGKRAVCVARMLCLRVCLPQREAGVYTGQHCSALRWRLLVLCGGEGHVRRPWLRRGGGASALATERWWRFLRTIPPPPNLRPARHRALGLMLWQGILQQPGILLWQGIPHTVEPPASGTASRTK